MPSAATFKSMGGTLLERSGYPVITANREGWSLWDTLRGRLKNLGITVLWIDEAHDLLCADKNVILRAIKALMQEGCPLGGNVFLAPDWPQIDPDRSEEDAFPLPERARRRRK